MSNTLREVLEHNQKFIQDEAYLPYQTSGQPKRKMLVLTCMDTRLTELLPKAMGIRNGDAKVIKNAGAMLMGPNDDTIRSMLVAFHALGATEIFVVGHEKCGMASLSSQNLTEQMRDSGVAEEALEAFDTKNWLIGFDDVDQNVYNSVKILSEHPLFPKETVVHGLVISPETGALRHLVSKGDDVEVKQ